MKDMLIGKVALRFGVHWRQWMVGVAILTVPWQYISVWLGPLSFACLKRNTFRERKPT